MRMYHVSQKGHGCFRQRAEVGGEKGHGTLQKCLSKTQFYIRKRNTTKKRRLYYSFLPGTVSQDMLHLKNSLFKYLSESAVLSNEKPVSLLKTFSEFFKYMTRIISQASLTLCWPFPAQHHIWGNTDLEEKHVYFSRFTRFTQTFIYMACGAPNQGLGVIQIWIFILALSLCNHREISQLLFSLIYSLANTGIVMCIFLWRTIIQIKMCKVPAFKKFLVSALHCSYVSKPPSSTWKALWWQSSLLIYHTLHTISMVYTYICSMLLLLLSRFSRVRLCATP